MKLILQEKKILQKKKKKQREMVERDGIGHNSVVRQGES